MEIESGSDGLTSAQEKRQIGLGEAIQRLYSNPDFLLLYNDFFVDSVVGTVSSLYSEEQLTKYKHDLISRGIFKEYLTLAVNVKDHLLDLANSNNTHIKEFDGSQ